MLIHLTDKELNDLADDDAFYNIFEDHYNDEFIFSFRLDEVKTAPYTTKQ